MGIKPPVWRRVVVPSSITLAELHEVLQGAFGWWGYHLHEFDIDGVRYGVGDGEAFEIDDQAAHLAAIRKRADDEDRSVSSWIRRAVEHQLSASAGQTLDQTDDDRPARTSTDQRARKPAVTRTKADQAGRRRTRKSAS